MLAQQLLNSLTDGVTPPPGGTVIEDPPTASWAGVAWGAVGSVGVEKIDACPGLFGSVDISVTANVVMLFTPDVSVTPPVLNLQVHVSSDASDWDSFRCWLGSGGIGSLLLGAITNPIVGILAGIGTLIAVGEIIRVKAGSEVTGGSLGAGLTKVSGDDTSATYTGTRPLPTLATTPGSSTDAATIGPLGLIVTGRILFLSATHAVAFNPDGGTLSANFAQSFSCNSRSWTRSVEVQSVQVTDRAGLHYRPRGGPGAGVPDEFGDAGPPLVHRRTGTVVRPNGEHRRQRRPAAGGRRPRVPTHGAPGSAGTTCPPWPPSPPQRRRSTSPRSPAACGSRGCSCRGRRSAG